MLGLASISKPFNGWHLAFNGRHLALSSFVSTAGLYCIGYILIILLILGNISKSFKIIFFF